MFVDVSSDQHGLVAMVYQSVELSLSPPLHRPPFSRVTGPAQEQLLLPLPVSTALYHSLSKSLRLCV